MFTVSKLAEKCGVSTKTIRYYESIGLLSPDVRDKFTSYRYYSEGKVEELNRILFLKELGFTLKEIQELDECVIENKVKETVERIGTMKNNLVLISSLNKIKGEEGEASIIGNWSLVGCVAREEDFFENKIMHFKTIFHSFTFLPNGKKEGYSSWNKDFVILHNGEMTSYNNYKMFKHKNEDFMFLYFNNVAGNTNPNIRVYKKIE